MQVSYHKDYSGELGRDMEYKRYGYAGRPVVVFPTSSGRFYQFEDSGAIAALGEFIDTGRIQVLTREAAASNGRRKLKPLFAGCSMGAFHAANFVFRFPELTSGVIALSGVYSTKDFFGDALDGAIFFNSPLNYLPGLSYARLLKQLRALRLIFCCGQGRWEERMLEDTHALEEMLRDKNISAWVDYWGGDVDHDWPWWHKQLAYFMSRWLDDDLQHRVA